MDEKTKARIKEITITIYDLFAKSLRTLPDDIVNDKLYITGLYNTLINLTCNFGFRIGMDFETINLTIKKIWNGIKDEENKFLN